MHRRSEWQSVAEAEGLVAEGRRRLERQREIVAQMQSNGNEFTRASALLLHMLAAQERDERQLAKLLSWLENGRA